VEKFRAGQAKDDVIWHMHCACWITKATNTHAGCVIITAFPQQQWLLSVMLYVHCLSCLSFV
jgi:hypothetical protein